eukprot:1490366-Pleurochrysis_carterae.AAC.2
MRCVRQLRRVAYAAEYKAWLTVALDPLGVAAATAAAAAAATPAAAAAAAAAAAFLCAGRVSPPSRPQQADPTPGWRSAASSRGGDGGRTAVGEGRAPSDLASPPPSPSPPPAPPPRPPPPWPQLRESQV